MSFYEALQIVRPLVQELDDDEQMRLLQFFQSSKLVPFREVAALKIKHRRTDGPSQPPENKITMAVAGRK